MSNASYAMITVAAVETGYQKEALGKVDTLAGELRADAGAMFARYGVLITGDHVGSLILMQAYSEMNGIDRAFDVYGQSDAYAAMISSGKLSVTVRNIIKLEDVGLDNPSADLPAFGVLTRWGAADLMLDRLTPMTPLFEQNGAMILRYGTIMTGIAAGRRLLGVGYPSMDAIEKTYGALMESQDYAAVVADIDLDFRNIFKYVG